MIGVIDYGMGNLYSVCKALERLQIAYVLSDDISVLQQADGLILPGVGAFSDGAFLLQEKGLDVFIKKQVQQQVPLLGICLGMQLLFTESEEHGKTNGLNLLPGRVRAFSGCDNGVLYKVPHMGWNQLQIQQPHHPLTPADEQNYVYFVHSYVVDVDRAEDVIISSYYHRQVPALVGSGYVFGTQFHPEKSGPTGMTILQRYGELVQSYQTESPSH